MDSSCLKKQIRHTAVFTAIFFFALSACRQNKPLTTTERNLQPENSMTLTVNDVIEKDTKRGCNYNRKNFSFYQNISDFSSLSSNDTLTILPCIKNMRPDTGELCHKDIRIFSLQHYFDSIGNLEKQYTSVNSPRPLNFNDSTIYGNDDKHSQTVPALEDLYRYFSLQAELKIAASSYRSNYDKQDLVKPDDPFPFNEQGNLYPTFSSSSVFAAWLTAQLRANRPVLTKWREENEQWKLIIGIDNNGTPDFTNDDILLFTVPYTSPEPGTRKNDIIPLEHFFFSWQDTTASRPYQLQPYLVIDTIPWHEAESWYLDTVRLKQEYLTAVENACTPTARKICHSLPAITSPGDNYRMEWIEGKDKKPFILVCTMTSSAKAQSWPEDCNSIPENRYLWVTLPYDLEEHLRLSPLCSDSLECRMQILQMLGLPPHSPYDCLMFFYAERDHLFRPCPDPEINDSETSLDFPPGTSQEHRKWFTNNLKYSYLPSSPYPWTQLGYTYNWHHAAINTIGPGEFIAPPGTGIKIKRIVTVWSWYKERFL